MRWLLVLALASCQSVKRNPAPAPVRASPVPEPVPEPVPVASPSSPPPAPPAPPVTQTELHRRVNALVKDPLALLAAIDPARGVVIAVSTGCESEESTDLVERACGARADELLRDLLPGLGAGVRRAQLDDQVGCKGNVCRIRPVGECNVHSELRFTPDGHLATLVMRDDWQSSEDVQRAFSRRLAALLAKPAVCP